MAHTRGPWTQFIDRPSRTLVIMAAGCPGDIAQVTWLSGEEKEAVDNARLIAAAPKLLEALRELLAVWPQYPDDDTPEPREIRAARAAIAAATGGE